MGSGKKEARHTDRGLGMEAMVRGLDFILRGVRNLDPF